MNQAVSPLSTDAVAASVAAAPFLALRGVHKRFAGVHALRGVDLSIEPGRIYHLMGENGCGKSTLIKIISGAQPPDEGDIVINGVAAKALTPLAALKAGVETVYQDLSLLPNLTVADNIALSQQLVEAEGRLARSVNRRRLIATAAHALEAVRLPASARFWSLRIEDLPIATRQLVAIARAIATEAKLVIMDEPTSALTKREVDNLIAVVGRLRESGVAVLFVTHKLDESKAIGGRFVVMRDGGKIAEGDLASVSKAELSYWMTGRELQSARYRSGANRGAPLLEVSGLERRRAFHGVSFTLGRGEILGVTGLLDSGRNELARALAGITPADGGEVRLGGAAVSLARPIDALNAGIGYVPEDRLSEGLFLEKPIRANIVVQVLDRLRSRFGFIDKKKSDGLAAKMASDLQIAAADLSAPVQSLSGGNQQRVLIGRGLSAEPRLLVLHGPTVGVDVGSKDTIYRIVERLACEGMSILMVSDDLPELLQTCDRVIVMRKGRIAETFEAAQADEETIYRAMIAESAPEGRS